VRERLQLLGVGGCHLVEDGLGTLFGHTFKALERRHQNDGDQRDDEGRHQHGGHHMDTEFEFAQHREHSIARPLPRGMQGATGHARALYSAIPP
jgi:hypothetical protein